MAGKDVSKINIITVGVQSGVCAPAYFYKQNTAHLSDVRYFFRNCSQQIRRPISYILYDPFQLVQKQLICTA